MLDRIRRELSKSFIKRGVLGTLKIGPVLVLARFKEWAQGERIFNRRSKLVDPFDERFGVETAGIIHLGALNIASENWVHGLQYEPIVTLDFQALLVPTGIDMAAATFIDIGSGKGRAVLLAVQMPFKRIMGVEFSAKLHSIAEENLRIFPEKERRCRDVTLILTDAADFNFPDGPLVIYLYNPFEAPVMQQVVANLAATYRIRPRPIVVLYFTPLCADLWRELTFLEQISISDDVAIFVSRS